MMHSSRRVITRDYVTVIFQHSSRLLNFMKVLYAHFFFEINITFVIEKYIKTRINKSDELVGQGETQT